MFFGTENRVLDEKGRLSFKRDVRNELGPNPIIVKKEQKIFIFPTYFQERFPPSKIWLGKWDKQGRLQIPMRLLKDFLGKWISIKGKGEYIQISPRKNLNFNEISIKEAKELFRKGIRVVPDADRRKVTLELEES